jgi:uncharacterized protein (TIGR02001 family)
VTATAALPRPATGRAASRWISGAFLILFANCLLAGRADAQWGGTLSLESDYRLRGYSLTDGNPAASAQVTYDHGSGFYLNLAGLAQIAGDDPRFMGVVGNVGYARRLSSQVTLDVGALRSEIRASERYGRPYRYTEIYAGAAVGRVLGRVYYSPDYRGDGVQTLYGELEAGFEPAREWRVSGHVGVLTYLTAARYWPAGSTHQDWRLSVSRQLGRFEVHSALSSGGPGERYYRYQRREKPVLTAGASVSF